MDAWKCGQCGAIIYGWWARTHVCEQCKGRFEPINDALAAEAADKKTAAVRIGQRLATHEDETP